MTPLFALSLLVGIVLVLAWIAAVAVAETVPGWDHVDPDRRYGVKARMFVGGLAGFGLGGMSATFAGWPLPGALAAAAAGAAAVAAAARFLVDERTEGDR